MKIIHFERFNTYVKGGLEDPCITGKIYGYVTALSYALTNQKSANNFILEPVFMKNHLEFDSEFQFKTTLWRLTYPVLIAVFCFPWLHSLRLWRKSARVKDT